MTVRPHGTARGHIAAAAVLREELKTATGERRGWAELEMREQERLGLVLSLLPHVCPYATADWCPLHGDDCDRPEPEVMP